MKAVLVIDTPNDCDECPLVSAINDMCILLNEDAFPNRWVEDAPYYSLKEKGDCPLRPFPERHGDLIDRKDLIENGLRKGFCDWYDEIKMADTIIEADTGETE